MVDERVIEEQSLKRFDDLKKKEEKYQELCFVQNFSKVCLIDGEFQKVPRQMEKVRDDQVVNNAGGYVFEASDVTKIRRFLILGTDSPTYYCTSKELTLENTATIIKLIEEGKSSLILQELEVINRLNRNPKMSPLLFVLAVCTRYGVRDLSAKSDNPGLKVFVDYINETQKTAFSLIQEVCRIPTHLFEFVKYCMLVAQATKVNSKSSTGWGRRMRKAISQWYTTKTAEKLAMFLTKYPQREGFSHRDLFRLSHPHVSDFENFEMRDDRLELEQIFRFAVKGDLLVRKRHLLNENEQNMNEFTQKQLDQELKSKSLDLIETYLQLKHEQNEEVIVEAIKTHKLVREHLPTNSLNSRLVWETLFDYGMPMTAMIRNLAKMTSINCLDRRRINTICERLTDADELQRSRIHPMALLNAKAIYEAGCGDRGKLRWIPIPEIIVALENGFYKSFINAPITGKRFLVAIDISGSMGSSVSGSILSCQEVATAMAVIHLRTEPLVKCVAFSDGITELSVPKDCSMNHLDQEILKYRFSRTDCSLPMLWAAEKNLEFDVFIVYTDNETWAGDVHPFEAIKYYREKMNIPDARLVVMGMQAVPFTIADPNDKGMMDVCGFDTAVPQVLHEFIMGNV